MTIQPPGPLLAILSNPPLTGGTRTLRRVDQAALALGYPEVEISNLFSIPSRAIGAIKELGVEGTSWLEARSDVSGKLAAASAVLLAYGTTAPAGPARTHFRAQVAWLHSQLIRVGVPSWWVGDGPRHPSRWQRWTHRTHRGVPFAQALAISLAPANLKPSDPPDRFVQSRSQDRQRAQAMELG